MTTTTKRWLWTASLMILLALPLVFALLSPGPADSDERVHKSKKRAEASTWASLLSRDEIFRALDDAERLSAQQVRAAFSKLSPVDRSTYWRQRVDRFAAGRNLNPKKIAALKAIKDLLTPAFFENPTLYRPQHTEVSAITEAALEPAEQRAIGIGLTFARGSMATKTIAMRVRELLAVHAVVDDCNCAQEQPNSYRCPRYNQWGQFAGNRTCRGTADCNVAEDECYFDFFVYGDCYGACDLEEAEGG